MTDPGLTDLIAAHHSESIWSDGAECVLCACGNEYLMPGLWAAHVALVVEHHTNRRIAELEARIARVEKLAAEYARDDQEHLNTFGQHHPVAGIAHDHVRAALEGEQQ